MRVHCSLTLATAGLLLSVVACSSGGAPELGATADALSTSMTTTLRTTVAPAYVTAENGGGGAVNANRATAAGWETFTLVDSNGGALQSGDAVFLKAQSGAYLQASGTALNAAGASASTAQTFHLVRQKGAGAVAAGDVVGLQASTGKWVSATNGGGAGVSAAGAAMSTWEDFTIQFPGGLASTPVTTADAGASTPVDSGTTTGTSPGGSSGAGSSCAASAAGNAPLGKDSAPASGTVVDAITIQNVGGTGSYDKVVSMAPGTWPTCTDKAAACVKATKTVSGPLVPFDEEQSMVFSGPMDLYEIGVYYPTATGFSRVSHWDRCSSDNLTFMNNAGGGTGSNNSGTWSICAGGSQSYASSDGAGPAGAPTRFAGHLEGGKGVNVMQGTACKGAGDGSECGFYRDVGLHGWSGAADGTKIFAVKMRMPLGSVTPAYWILPAQVLRTAQYGCNCRGMGGAGGCGELDVAEVLSGQDPLRATSTIYSFKSVTGGGAASFQRPVLETATFVVIFDGTGTISMRKLGTTDFDFGAAIPAATVNAWRANLGAVRPM